MAKPKRALITGITGQDGSYLAEFLLEQGYEVIGMIRRSSTVNFERIRHIQEKITLVSGDLLDEVSMINMLRENRPTEVYNLAAQSFVQTSWAQPVFTGETTALGVTRVLDAIRIVDPDIRFYQASSARCSAKLSRCRSASRRHSTRAARMASPRSTATGSRSTIARATGCTPIVAFFSTTKLPRRGLEFVTRKITNGVARIKLGLDKELRLGNLESQRDWGFAGDYVKAMWLMLQQDQPDDYVVATGQTQSVRRFCELAFGHVGLDYRDYVVLDERFMRPAEVDLLVGDSSKAREVLGWQPETSFEELVRMMVEADIALLKVKR